eukprot:SAG31_NODE_8753_length_1394_cov_1.398456_1_plen_104_part_10
MADANNIGDGFAQFEMWYLQAGTPQITASASFDSTVGRYTLVLEQTCAPTPGQPEKKPYHIPVAVGLIDSQSAEDVMETRVLELREASQTFVFELGDTRGRQQP